MKTVNQSTVRAQESRTNLINKGGERLEVRLVPGAAAQRQLIMEKRGIKKKTDLIEILLKEEAQRLSKRC